MDTELWSSCVEFHGHSCAGLAIGYRQSLIALERTGSKFDRAKDEELVCEIENDACSVDAVQVITGCTLGKGNLLYRSTGKMALSLYNRQTKKAVRIVMHPDLSTELGWNKEYILEAPAESIFLIKALDYKPPEKAFIFGNVKCDQCGENTAENMIRLQGGKKLCPDCFQDYSRGW